MNLDTLYKAMKYDPVQAYKWIMEVYDKLDPVYRMMMEDLFSKRFEDV